MTLYPPLELTLILGSLRSTPRPACTNPHDPPEDSLGPYLERLRRRTLTAFLSAYGNVYALRSAEIDVREMARQKTGPRLGEPTPARAGLSSARTAGL